MSSSTQTLRRQPQAAGPERPAVWVVVRRFAPLGVLVLFALLPYTNARIPVLFDGALNSPGTLQLLAICLVFGGLALGYDLMFGRTGMLSFGHALYFAAGGYGTAILLDRTAWPLWTVAVAAITGTAGGAVA